MIHFLDLFETQTTLARLTDADHFLFLPTCLTEKAVRWYHHEKDSKGTYTTYAELRAAFRARFTTSKAERKSLKVKLRALKQWEEDSVIDFNHRFEAVASCCTLGDDEAKEIYLDCLRVKLREALAISTTLKVKNTASPTHHSWATLYLSTPLPIWFLFVVYVHSQGLASLAFRSGSRCIDNN